MIELVIVLVVGAILTAIVVVGFGSMRGGMTVSSARSTFLTMHAATRSLAVERGTSMRLVVNSVTGTMTIEEGCGGGGTVVQTETVDAAIHFKSGTSLALCMTPRGFADPAGNSFESEGYLAFTVGSHTAELTILPLGQVVSQ